MKILVILSIRAYQLISPILNAILLSVFGFHFRCKQIPSCSVYTIQQINKYGTITGLKKGLIRIMQCR